VNNHSGCSLETVIRYYKQKALDYGNICLQTIETTLKNFRIYIGKAFERWWELRRLPIQHSGSSVFARQVGKSRLFFSKWTKWNHLTKTRIARTMQLALTFDEYNIAF